MVKKCTKCGEEKALLYPAKELILGGLAELNYSVCQKTDAAVSAGDTVSVRGFGKFVIKNITDETKKGRLRLEAGKYI